MSRPQNSPWALTKPIKSSLGPIKVKNYSKIKPNSKVRIEGFIENESCSTTWAGKLKVFEPYPNPKNSLLGFQKVKNDLKIMSKSNVRIEWTIENKSCSATWVDPKTV